MADILLLNGPNLNMLGQREPDYYGAQDLDDIVDNLTAISLKNSLTLEHYQSNAEAQLIDCIHGAYVNKIKYIIINPAAFTHTSIALRDALLAVAIPFIEVHISNIHKREDFRKKSYFADIAQGVICGLGVKGYEFALDYAIRHIKQTH